MKRVPIRTVAELNRLDDDQVKQGYRHGYQGGSEPDETWSYSYWSGWRSGSINAGFMEHDDASLGLLEDMLREAGIVRKVG